MNTFAELAESVRKRLPKDSIASGEDVRDTLTALADLVFELEAGKDVHNILYSAGEHQDIERGEGKP